MEPWHVSAQLVNFRYRDDTYPLVRVSLLNGDPVLADRSSIDLDPSGKLGEALNRPELLGKARDFLPSIGYKIPVPIGPNTLHSILTFKRFPTREEWEGFNSHYSESSFHEDLKHWSANKHVVRTWEEHWGRLLKAGTGQNYCSHIEGQYAYAARVLWLYRYREQELKTFYRTSPEVPEAVQTRLLVLEDLAQRHVPYRPENQKKLSKSAAERSTPTEQKKKGKKKAVSESQNSFSF